MRVEYTHKGYRYVWADGGEKDLDMGGDWVYDPYGNPLMHVTTNGTPPTEVQAIERIEATIEIMERLVKKLEDKFIRGEE